MTKPAKYLAISGVIWASAEFGVGTILGLMNNTRCFKYLGCNAGFFGFDALVHFLGGILYVTLILWLIDKYPKLNILHNNFWKNAIILLAIVVLMGVFWEIIEFSTGHFRTFVLHQNLTIKNMPQPSNSDTMGDLIFGLFGGVAAVVLLKIFSAEIVQDKIR